MHRIAGWPYVYRRGNGALYYVRRVPTDIADIIEERQFKRSMKHRDHRLPAFKAAYDSVHREVETYIAKIRSGRAAPEAQRRYQEAVLRAQRLGFDLRPMDTLADESVSIDELMDRLLAVEERLSAHCDPTVDAVLGAVNRPAITFAGALEMYEDLQKIELRGKNANQLRRWRNPLELAVRNFEEAVGKRSLDHITRDDALSFREWWAARIGLDVESANTANKNLMALRKIFRTINDTHRLGLDNPFDGLRIAEQGKATRLSIPREWLEQTLLAGDALDALNAEAKGVIGVMADTGARVNEITGLAPADINLDADVPHILIRANSIRSLKTAHSERVIPLVGVALTAMRASPDGFPRYAGKNSTASAAINKYLRNNDLLPPSASLYGLRHGFQDRLIEVEAPERIQADLMVHKTLRPKYGKGPSLQQMRAWLEKTALHPVS
ncbi:MAG: hypothetical protein AAF220_10685, partial [Pseudomonadota bacterium]